MFVCSKNLNTLFYLYFFIFFIIKKCLRNQIRNINTTLFSLLTTSNQNMSNHTMTTTTTIPDIVPCHTSLCKSYIINFVGRNKDNLNSITGNRNYLHEFLRDFFVDIKQKFGQELYEDFDYHGI